MRTVRLPATVGRVAAALTLGLAAIGTSLGVASPAQAASYTMCSASPVPAGYVVTQAYRSDPTCGGFLRYYITNDLYNGMSICSATAVPVGWVATSAYSGDPNCAYQFLRYSIVRVA